MEHLEFLIQREGDRGLREIKTGNLQLAEGKYRIVASSQAIETRVSTRITYQSPDSTASRQKSKTDDRITDRQGIVEIIPFTHLQPGIWQFVCSNATVDRPPCHKILNLRVLPQAVSKSSGSPNAFSGEKSGDITIPTDLIIPIERVAKQPNLADGLDLLLEQLERESLKPSPQVKQAVIPNLLQFTPLAEPPLHLLNLDRTAFSGVIPGNRLSLSGACNLRLFKADFVSVVKVSKLLICLRHPQTAEVIVSIEQPLLVNLELFAFRCQIQLPIDSPSSLLMGEVNLYDRHNIQVATTSFTVTIDLDPIHESDLSFLQLLDERKDRTNLLDRLVTDLQLEPTLTQNRHGSIEPSIPTPTQEFYPSVPNAYKRESLFVERLKVVPIEPSTTDQNASKPLDHIQALDFDFDQLQIDPSWDSLEIVVD